MLKLTLMLICLQSALISFSQSAAKTVSSKDSTNPAFKFIKEWEKNFFDEVFSIEKDSFRISDESKKLLLDSEYRKSVYPIKYNWPQAIQLMNKMELKKAFWHLINIYRTEPEQRQLVMQTFIMYDSVVNMQKVLVNTFYTYAFTDPEISVFKNGKPVVSRPDVLESKLAEVKYITSFIVDYRLRKQKAIR